MEPSEAIKVIREFQAWRRGGDQPMPYPQTTGEALDALCYHAERLERELEQERQDRKQADLDTIRALGERNTARLERDTALRDLANERELADKLGTWVRALYRDKKAPTFCEESVHRAINTWEECRK